MQGSDKRSKKHIIVFLLLSAFFFPASASGDATYDANGIWKITTTCGLVYGGCSQSDGDVSSSFPTIIEQSGNTCFFVAGGIPFSGTISGSTYSASATFPEDWGSTTYDVSFTLSSETAGTGSYTWTWTDGWNTCWQTCTFTLAKQTAPPTYNATGIWEYSATTGFATSGCTPDPDQTGYSKIVQNDDTFTYTDELGIHTGRIAGNMYISSIRYQDGSGYTNQTIIITLNSASSGSGNETWTWSNGTSCSGGRTVTITKQTALPTYNATGIWNYTAGTDSGKVTITQDGYDFRMVGYKGTQSGLATAKKYVCYLSYPESNGTTFESIIIDLTSSMAGSGTVDWYWTNGFSESWGTKAITLNKTATVNNPPAAPVLTSPANGATGTALTLTLQTGSFSDPDQGDGHFQTEWQVSKRSDFASTALVIVSDTNLTTLTIPQFVLEIGTTYYWRVRFYDNNSGGSSWSSTRSFTTSPTNNDPNGNGIPEAKENNTADLDNDAVYDINQTNIIKTINTVGNAQIGASRRNSTTITAINSIDSLDPDSISTIARPNSMPFGMITIDMSILKPAGDSEVTIYFGTNGTKQSPPGGASWYMYDSIKGWINYSDKGLATFNGDGTVTLKLKDWGHGDSDGLPNGSIIDPGGVGLSGSIGVTVKDFNTNADIPNAAITFKGSLPGEVYTYTAASDGTYATPLRSGSWTVVVSARGYAAQSVPVVMGEQGLVVKDIKLRPAGILSPLMLLLE